MALRITQTDFSQKVLEAKLLVLVDFYSDSCVACKKLAPVLGGAEDDFEDQILVYKVNTNFDAELASEYGIMSNPTVLIFKEGKEVDRKVGFINPKDLNEWIEKYI